MSVINSSQTMFGLSWVCYTLLRKLLENARSGSCLIVGFWECWAWDKGLNADCLPGKWAQEVGVRKQEKWVWKERRLAQWVHAGGSWASISQGAVSRTRSASQNCPERKEELRLCHQLLSALLGAFWIWAELSYHLEKDLRKKTREPLDHALEGEMLSLWLWAHHGKVP